MQLSVLKNTTTATPKIEKKSSKTGLLALCLKLGLKFLPALLKMFKLLKAGKVALIGASLGAYAFLFSWQFAVMLVAMIFVHEYGHVWAMKRRGMKVKGMYFIPFVGAVAVGGEEFPSRKTEVYTAMMGPLWGFGFSAAIGGIYLMTHNPIFAAGAAWLALINLFNMLPIAPLDGGRIVKSITHSISSRVGMAFYALTFLLAIGLAFKLGLWLLVVLFPIGALEAYAEYRSKQQKPKMTGKQTLATAALYVGLSVALLGLMAFMGTVSGAEAAFNILR